MGNHWPYLLTPWRRNTVREEAAAGSLGAFLGLQEWSDFVSQEGMESPVHEPRWARGLWEGAQASWVSPVTAAHGPPAPNTPQNAVDVPGARPWGTCRGSKDSGWLLLC